MDRYEACRQWQEHWMQRMDRYCPGRERYFHIIAEAIAERSNGATARVLDLGCGSGGFTAIALTQIPDLEIYAVDGSEKSLFVAQTLLGSERVHWIRANITDPTLFAEWPADSLDAIFTGWTSHEIEAEQLPELYRRCLVALRPGGQLLNFDFMLRDTPETHQHLSDLARETMPQEWSDFDAAFTAEFFPSYEKPPYIQGNRGHHPVALHQHALLDAGFRQVEERFRHFNQSLLVAVR